MSTEGFTRLYGFKAGTATSLTLQDNAGLIAYLSLCSALNKHLTLSIPVSCQTWTSFIVQCVNICVQSHKVCIENERQSLWGSHVFFCFLLEKGGTKT